MSAFHDVRAIAPQQIWEGVVGRSVHGAEATFAVLNLDPGITVPGHAHANEQIGLLVHGSVRFTVGDEVADLRPGALWVIPANVMHSVEVGPGGASIVEIFSPPRGDWDGLSRLAPGVPKGFGLGSD
jgi:quercetin dioxygenase-like cupin family protein